MAFGLTGAPGTFQGTMTVTLAPGLRKFATSNKCFSGCVRINENSKCPSAVLFESPSPTWGMLSSLLVCPLTCPRFRQLWTGRRRHLLGICAAFLGLAGYYHKFVKNFGILAKPLTDLLRKDQQFLWTSSHATAFQSLKDALCTTPVLALPDFSQPFHIYTDASGMGIGAVLHQNDHPLLSYSLASHSALVTWASQFMKRNILQS